MIHFQKIFIIFIIFRKYNSKCGKIFKEEESIQILIIRY